MQKMKLKGRSIWEVSTLSKASWGWSFLLSLRDKVRPNIKHCVGNELMIFAWHDAWIGEVPLSKYISHIGLCDERLESNMKVVDCFMKQVGNGQWVGWKNIPFSKKLLI